MKLLILISLVLLTSCASDAKLIHTQTKQQKLSHASFYDFYLDAPAGEFRTWKDEQLFSSINFAGFSSTIKFFDIFPHEKWSSGLRLTLQNDEQKNATAIDFLMSRENNRIVLAIKSADKTEATDQSHMFFLDEYIRLQIIIDDENHMNAIINGASESIPLTFKPTALQFDAIGSDAHITLDVFEKK